MIGYIEGKLIEALPTQVVVETGGVGYEIFIPVSAYERLPLVGERIRLFTHLVVREDEFSLYGFLGKQERDLFRLLINHVSGVGPKIALCLIGGIDPIEFKRAVYEGDVRTLAQIKGIGKKLAQRVIIELQDKLRGTTSTKKEEISVLSQSDKTFEEVMLALMSLGLKQAEAYEAAISAKRICPPSASVEDLIKEALKIARG